MLTAEQVKEQLTTENIIQLCCELQGDDVYYTDSQGRPLFSTSLDHEGGDSYKLCYFPDSKLFYCWTRGTTKDIFDIVKFIKGFESFNEAFFFVCNYFHLSSNNFEEAKPELTDDWDIFYKMDNYKKLEIKEETHLPKLQENLLCYFGNLAAPTEWLKNGISAEVMRYYGIRVDSALDKIIIPHRDIDGNLIGIRGRTYDPIELAKGQKYMPVFIEKDIYNHPLGQNLFGIYENKETIQRLKKVLICESEKAVLQTSTFYGINNCFCVATCGSAGLSQKQIDLLLSLGVEEIILGYDREYQGGKDAPDTIEYEQKLLKIVQPLTPYFDVYVIMDYTGKLGYKDSPTDSTKEVLEYLMKHKIYIPSISAKIKKKRRER